MWLRSRDRAKPSCSNADVRAYEDRKDLKLKLRLGNDVRAANAVLLIRPERAEAPFSDQR